MNFRELRVAAIHSNPFRPLSFGDGIAHLRAGYRRGLLVPFIGSGLSAPKLRLWAGLVGELARLAGVTDLNIGDRPTTQQLILASERVVWQLRVQGRPLGQVMNMALPDPTCPPERTSQATEALASVWWPLVLSTNYDALFVEAFNRRHHRARHMGDAMAVLGRGAADCHTVLASLNVAFRPLLWALQGFIGSSLHGADLSSEIVLGYEQYRQAMFDNPGFRAAFSEVFRNRSMLFAGAGLNEDYFRGLFGESIVRLGANQHAHCTLVNEADLGADTPWFLHTRLNIIVLTYRDPPGAEKYSGFVPCLEEISQALREPPRGGRRFFVRGSSVSVEIEPTGLPTRTAEGHWVVGSAGRGGSGEVRVSRDVPKPLLEGEETALSGDGDLLRIKGKPVLLAVARKPAPGSGRVTRDLRQVAVATQRALQAVAGQGASTVSLMLLSASTRSGRWPRVFSLIEMLRGIRHFAKDRASDGAAAIRIVIHDTAAARTDGDPNQTVWHAVETGKLDPAEVLDCAALRFFVEIDVEGAAARTPMYVAGEYTLRQVADYLQLRGHWKATMEPDPAPLDGGGVVDLETTLLDAGVVPGTRLRFVRADDALSRTRPACWTEAPGPGLARPVSPSAGAAPAQLAVDGVAADAQPP